MNIYKKDWSWGFEHDGEPRWTYGIFPRYRVLHSAWCVAPINITIKSCPQRDKKLEERNEL